VGNTTQNWLRGRDILIYKRLNEVLDGEQFDEFCDRECAQFYAKNSGRPSSERWNIQTKRGKENWYIM
jgi:hypothetical protein